MAVHMGERFKQPAVQNEITRLVRQNPRSVIGVPEAMHYLLGDGLVQGNRNSLKVGRHRGGPYCDHSRECSGFRSGHLCRLSRLWRTSVRDMAIILSSFNMR